MTAHEIDRKIRRVLFYFFSALLCMANLVTALTLPATTDDWIDIRKNIDSSMFKEAAVLLTGYTVNSHPEQVSALTVERTTGNVYFRPANCGAYKSTDQGRTFKRSNAQDVEANGTLYGFGAIQSSSNDSGKIAYFYWGDKTRGYYTLNGGTSWHVINPAGFRLSGGAVNLDGDGKLILIAEFEGSASVWVSKDGGTTFSNTGISVLGTAGNVGAGIGILPGNVFMACLDDGTILRSIDTGVNWQPASGPNTLKGPVSNFKGKSYWLANDGVYSTADTGKNWDLVGSNFPAKAYGGPYFGKDENQMIVLLNNTFIETMDGGQTWNTLAAIPGGDGNYNVGSPCQECNRDYTAGYDAVNDILYCHIGIPYASSSLTGGFSITSKLVLNRWGSKADPTAPSAPRNCALTLASPDNRVFFSWSAPSGNSCISGYQVFQNGVYLLSTPDTVTFVKDLAWSAHYTYSVRARDCSGNLSSLTDTIGITIGGKTNFTYLSDLNWVSTTGGEISVNGILGEPLILVQSYSPYYLATADYSGLSTTDNSLSTIVYALNKKYTRFTCNAGVQTDGDPYEAQMTMTVKADGVIKYNAAVGKLSPSAYLNIDVTNVDTLTLSVPSIYRGVADWADAILYAPGTPGSIQSSKAGLMPRALALAGAFPNPFFGVTQIRFAVPKDQEVSINIYDITGRLVKSLTKGVLPAGYHRVAFNAQDNDGKTLVNGVYFCRMQAKGFEKVKKLLLVQ